MRLLDTAPPTPTPNGIPTRTDPIQNENEWCVYGDTIPYVREVKWNHPLIQEAMQNAAPGYRRFAYTEWRVPYGLENDRDGTDLEKSQERARNFMRVLCGEHRDYPEMLQQKLEAMAAGFGYAGPDEVASFDVTDNLFTPGHASSWQPQWASEPDMGFMRAFTSFDERMARFNQALDRHTNWGPTGYYMIDASDTGNHSPRFYGAYSPIVAASYDVSASDFFIRRDYSTTDAFERGRAKWLYVMKFPAARYYDMQAMRDGRPMAFDESYFSEPSLSNDFYNERALDHWGFIPGAEHHAEVYLTYGHAGMDPPALVPVPAP